jgi:hypothetical protein
MSRSYMFAGLLLLMLAFMLYTGLLPFEALSVLKAGGRYFEMTCQEPRAGTYGTVGARYDVAVAWIVKEKPPGEDGVMARFTVVGSSSGQVLLSSTSGGYQIIPDVGEGYWSWAQGSFIQPNEDIKVTCELVGHRSGAVLEVFEWIAYPISPPPPNSGVVEFDVGYYIFDEVREMYRTIPIENAECRLSDGKTYKTTTNVYGKARIEGVVSGVYVVTVSAPGYRSYQETITVKAGGGVIVWARLEPATSATSATSTTSTTSTTSGTSGTSGTSVASQTPPQGYTPPEERYSPEPSENPQSGMLTSKEVTASYSGWKLSDEERTALSAASALSGLVLLLYGYQRRR